VIVKAVSVSARQGEKVISRSRMEKNKVRLRNDTL